MKKFLLAALLFATAATTAIASNKDYKAVSNLLKRDFPAASNISYKEGKDFTTVNFVWNNQRLQAFYDHEGNKIGTSRAIQLDALPMKAYQAIQEKYAGYTATEAIEMDYVQQEVYYYVSLQNEKQKLILQISSYGEVSVFKKG